LGWPLEHGAGFAIKGVELAWYESAIKGLESGWPLEHGAGFASGKAASQDSCERVVALTKA